MSTITVVLHQVWLNSTSDPTDCMGFTLNGYVFSQTPNFTVSEWAGGTFRSAGTKGVSVSAQMTFGFISDAQVGWLQSHAGLPVWVRDMRGHRFVAIVPAVAATPFFVPDLWSVPLVFVGITHSDAV